MLKGLSRNGLLVAGAAIAFIGIFWAAMGNLWFRWGESQELSHSYFIPAISAWLVWTNREAVIKSIGAPSIYGAAALIAAGLFLLLGQVTHIFVIEHLGLVVAIAGLVAGFGGLSLLRVTAAPVAFLLFAVPPPYWFITVLSWKFQQISSIIGVWMIQLMDIPVYLSGNIIDLGDYKLQVAEACSGLRYLFPFLSLGVMTAYLYRGPLWQKAAIVLSTVPITIAMNSFRIAATGALVQAYGTSHAEGALHFFEGWVVFVLCLIALFALIFVFSWFSKPRISPLDKLGAPELEPVAPSAGAVKRPVMAAGVFGGAIAFFGLSQMLTTDALIIPERKDFAGVPAEFEGWESTVLPMDPSVAEVLGADDTIVVNLVSPEDEYFNVYMAYLDAQRDGRSWHSPRQCMPGGGWQIMSHDILETTVSSGRTIHYNRLIIQNRDVRQLVYYWYDQRGRQVANEFAMKFWLIVDAVIKKRSDGAMVRVITPILRGESVADADARLTAMMSKMDAFLPEYVPE